MRIKAIILTVSLLLGLVTPYTAVAGENDSSVDSVNTVVEEINSEGDVVLKITADELQGKGFSVGDEVRVELAGLGFDEKIPFFFVDGDSEPDEAALINNDGQAALSVNKGSFAEGFGYTPQAVEGSRKKRWTDSSGAQIKPLAAKITLIEKGKYLQQYNLRNPERSNDRDDYETDAGYANFREVHAGRIAPDLLYRSSSPINNALNRADYAAQMMKNLGVRCVINLSDDDKTALKYMEKSGNEYYKKLYDEGNVICLKLSYDFDSPEFKQGICKAVKFMGSHEGPYLFHCTEGKDRTGFLAVVLESLMGASVAEMSTDYMRTYKNFYDFDKGTQQFKYTRKNYLGEIFADMAGTKNRAQITETDFHKAAVDFLTSGGVSQEEIDTLVDILRKKDQPYEEIPEITSDMTGADANGKVMLGMQDENFTVFSGKEIKPGRRTLVINGTYMYNGRDYRIAYKTNKHAGTMKVTVSFKGRMQSSLGAKKIVFEYGITPKPVTKDDVRVRLNKKETKVKFVKDIERKKAVPRKYYTVDMEKREITFYGDYSGVVGF